MQPPKKEATDKQESIFFAELAENKSVVELSKFYAQPINTILNKLKIRIVFKWYKTGAFREISINFTDTNSGIRVHHKIEFSHT